MKRFFQLECGVQHYAWGAKKKDNEPPFIAELLGVTPTADEPFAELWIGAHPKCPARVRRDPGGEGAALIALDEFIKTDPSSILGEKVVDAGYETLPFLLKVLDAAGSLSIQAHPDLALAAELHARAPDHYPDANHKPEIAVSWRGLDALCGFRNVPDIRADVERLEPLSAFFAEFADEPDDDIWLRSAYAALFEKPVEDVANVVGAVAELLEQRPGGSANDAWFLKLNKQYPGDRGVICVYFLNVMHLEPGEALYLGAGEPHAYLHGTIIECMASSDNVVRAGLTPKFIDAQTLLKMLTYDTGAPPVLNGDESSRADDGDGRIRSYPTPASEFKLEFIELNPGSSISIDADGMVGILLVIDGDAILKTSADQTFDAKRGTAWLWPAALKAATLTCESEKAVTIIRARPNISPRVS